MTDPTIPKPPDDEPIDLEPLVSDEEEEAIVEAEAREEAVRHAPRPRVTEAEIPPAPGETMLRPMGVPAKVSGGAAGALAVAAVIVAIVAHDSARFVRGAGVLLDAVVHTGLALAAVSVTAMVLGRTVADRWRLVGVACLAAAGLVLVGSLPGAWPMSVQYWLLGPLVYAGLMWVLLRPTREELGLILGTHLVLWLALWLLLRVEVAIAAAARVG